MKCLSKVFQPIITIPKDAKIKSTEITCRSQKLLVECGLVRPTSAGLFALLPLARRALHKLETLAARALEAAGAQQVALPALAAAALWARSGRLHSAPAELLKVDDRHGKKYILAPGLQVCVMFQTHEEGIADLLADVSPLSYKQLPIILYQMSSKYRDELRPKHGLLRAREFLMLDAYGVHATEACARAAYDTLTAAYQGLFDELQLQVHRVSAPGGEMGGSMSHEWHVCAPAGEDELRVCAACSRASETSACAHCGQRAELQPSIEVGHTFMLGSRYAQALGATVTPPAGPAHPPLMTCYGIGLTRLLAAALEALSSETALRWPARIAPYNTLIIGPKAGSAGAGAGAERQLRAAGRAARRAGGDALRDDRDHLSIGKRLLLADRMGYPNVVVVGRAALQPAPGAEPRYELHHPSPHHPSHPSHPAPAPALLTLHQLEQHLLHQHQLQQDPPTDLDLEEERTQAA